MEANLRASSFGTTEAFARPKKIRLYFDVKTKSRIVEDTIKAVSEAGISYTVHVTSEVTQARELLEQLGKGEAEVTQTNLAVVNVVRSASGPGLGYGSPI
jgi:hypothetical protein